MFSADLWLEVQIFVFSLILYLINFISKLPNVIKEIWLGETIYKSYTAIN